MSNEEQLEKRIAELKVELRQAETISTINSNMVSATTEQEILGAVAPLAEEHGVSLSTLNYPDFSRDGKLQGIYNVAIQDGQGQPLSLDSMPKTYFSIEAFPMFRLILTDSNMTIIENFATDPRVAAPELQEFVEATNIAAMIALPLQQGSEWQGLLAFNWDEPQQFSTEFLEVFRAIKPIASAIVSSRRTYLAEQEARKQSEFIASINADLSQATSDQEILNAVASLAEAHGVTLSTLSYLEMDEDNWPIYLCNLALQTGEGDPLPLDAIPETRHDLSNFPVFDPAWQNPKDVLFVENLLSDPRYANEAGREFAKQADIRSMIVLPLKRNEIWEGVLIFNWSTPQRFKPRLRDIFRAIQPTATTVMSRRRLVMNMESITAQSTEELTKERDFNTVILDATDLVVVTLDKDGRIAKFNRASETLTGYTADEVLGRHIWDLLLPPEQIAPVREVFDKLLFEELPNRYENEWLTKEGERRLLAWSNTFLRDDNNEVEFVISTGIDITEQRKAEQEREQLQQEIIEAQKRAIEELSTPIIPLLEGIIVMPLIGSIDSMRASDLMRSLLQGITQHRAKIVIMDITGVPIVDTGIAAHLDKTIQAARLKGARTIITGISDAVAETVIDLGIDWSNIETLRDLQSGLIAALESLRIDLTDIRS